MKSVTTAERTRTASQLHRMETSALKEMTSMMERKNAVEKEVLGLAISELTRRGVAVDTITLGLEDPFAEEEHE